MSDLKLPTLNLVTIAGRLTREAELRYTTGGIAYARFCVAVERRFKKGETWEKETAFINCQSWQKTAEIVARLPKGAAILVEGSLCENKWTGKDGTEKKEIQIRAERVQGLEWEARGDSGATQAAPRGSSAPVEIPEPLPEDDIPF